MKIEVYKVYRRYDGELFFVTNFNSEEVEVVNLSGDNEVIDMPISEFKKDVSDVRPNVTGQKYCFERFDISNNKCLMSNCVHNSNNKCKAGRLYTCSFYGWRGDK